MAAVDCRGECGSLTPGSDAFSFPMFCEKTCWLSNII